MNQKQRDRDGYTRMPIYIRRKHKRAFKDILVVILFVGSFLALLAFVGAVQAYHCQLDDWKDCVFRGKR